MTVPQGTPAGWRSGRVLRTVLMVLALGFLVAAVVDLGRRWEPESVRLEPAWVLGALAPALLAPLLQALAFIGLIEHLSGRAVPRWAALELYLDSQLARYTPGKVGLPAVRLSGAGRLGVSARVMGASLLIELMSWLAVGSAVGLLLILPGAVTISDWAELGGVAVLSIALLGFGVMLLVTVDRRRWPAFVRRSLLLEGRGPLLSWHVPLAQAAYWTCWGAVGALLAVGLGGAAATPFTAGGVVCLASVLGFLAFLAPAGVGVREAVIGVGLAPLLGAPAAVALGVIARGLSLGSDFGVWFLVRATGHVRRHTASRDSEARDETDEGSA